MSCDVQAMMDDSAEIESLGSKQRKSIYVISLANLMNVSSPQQLVTDSPELIGLSKYELSILRTQILCNLN